MSVAPRLVEQVRPVLRGRLVSGDALYCQKGLCRQLRAAGAHYVFGVKGNQSSLLEDVSLLFTEPPPGEVFHTAQTVDKHSGRLETRRLRASATLSAYLQEAGWPDVGLVLEVATWVRWPRHPARPVRHEVRYSLSSLPARRYSPKDVLRAVRQHRHIENRRHWARDVAAGEDACQVRAGHAPQVLAALRNGVLGLLYGHAVPNCATALRTHAWSPPAALLTLLGLGPP